jgi:hypothetical protein
MGLTASGVGSVARRARDYTKRALAAVHLTTNSSSTPHTQQTHHTMHQAEEDLEMQEVASGLSSDEESKDERLPRSIPHQISNEDEEDDDYLSDDAAQNQRALLLPPSRTHPTG